MASKIQALWLLTVASDLISHTQTATDLGSGDQCSLCVPSEDFSYIFFGEFRFVLKKIFVMFYLECTGFSTAVNFLVVSIIRLLEKDITFLLWHCNICYILQLSLSPLWYLNLGVDFDWCWRQGKLILFGE